MKNKAKFKSDAFAAIHSAAEGLYRAGGISKTILQEFDEACLVVPTELAPEQIKQIREANNVSLPVFARYLNASESTVQKWEMGAKHPSGMALKLLMVVQKHGLEILA